MHVASCKVFLRPGSFDCILDTAKHRSLGGHWGGLRDRTPHLDQRTVPLHHVHIGTRESRSSDAADEGIASHPPHRVIFGRPPLIRVCSAFSEQKELQARPSRNAHHCCADRFKIQPLSKNASAPEGNTTGVCGAETTMKAVLKRVMTEQLSEVAAVNVRLTEDRRSLLRFTLSAIEAEGLLVLPPGIEQVAQLPTAELDRADVAAILRAQLRGETVVPGHSKFLSDESAVHMAGSVEADLSPLRGEPCNATIPSAGTGQCSRKEIKTAAEPATEAAPSTPKKSSGNPWSSPPVDEGTTGTPITVVMCAPRSTDMSDSSEYSDTDATNITPCTSPKSKRTTDAGATFTAGNPFGEPDQDINQTPSTLQVRPAAPVRKIQKRPSIAHSAPISERRNALLQTRSHASRPVELQSQLVGACQAVLSTLSYACVLSTLSYAGVLSMLSYAGVLSTLSCAGVLSTPSYAGFLSTPSYAGFLSTLSCAGVLSTLSCAQFAGVLSTLSCVLVFTDFRRAADAN